MTQTSPTEAPALQGGAASGVMEAEIGRAHV